MTHILTDILSNQMKKILFIVLLISITTNIYSQKIDNTNYYNYQIKYGTTYWLHSCEAIPVIIDELLKNGIQDYTIGIGNLININDSTSVVVTVSFLVKNITYGFIYQDTHFGELDVSHRDFLTNSTKQSYMQFGKYKDIGYKCMEIKPLPENVFLLRETCYWYQYKPDGSNAIVTKEIAINIFRQDIRNYLKMIPYKE